MDIHIRDKVALITGASSGLGKACALALAAEGARVAISARRENELRAVAAQAIASGAPDAAIFPCDLGVRGSAAGVVRDVIEKFGAVDIVVANTGGPKPGSFTQLSTQDWDAAYDQLLRSVLELLETAVPQMRERRWGRIIALTSSSVKQPISTLVLSNAYRTALVSALKTLAGEVAADGITVNAIATGRVLTDRLRSLYGNDAAALAKAAQEVPMGRIADPEEFAPLVAFLAGELAGYITGQTISIDGGLVAGLFG